VLAGVIFVAFSAGTAGAFDAASVYPGCVQQRAWCERAAAASYGDRDRFRNALSAVVSAEWGRIVTAARHAMDSSGSGEIAAPSSAEVTDTLMRDWRAGSACCPVTLQMPEISGAEDYTAYCRRIYDGSKNGVERAKSCIRAIRSGSARPGG
jgi:hypothetical protein